VSLKTPEYSKTSEQRTLWGGPFVPCRVERLLSSDFLLNLLKSSRNKHLKVFHFDVFYNYEMATAKLLAGKI